MLVMSRIRHATIVP